MIDCLAVVVSDVSLASIYQILQSGQSPVQGSKFRSAWLLHVPPHHSCILLCASPARYAKLGPSCKLPNLMIRARP